MAGRELGVLLAVAALLVAASSVADDDGDTSKAWTCFRSCAKGCHHHRRDNGSATAAELPSGSGDAKVSAGDCKNGCQDDACFKDLPAISYTQCAIVTCLNHPQHSRKKTACLKDCCEKCFRNSPPAPGPPKPSPPKPEPGPPPTPGPGPTPPSPPN